MEQSVDVVVVGAGIAGLVAARELVRAGLEVVVLESRDRVGGRVLNEPLPGGAPIEMGGEWVGPNQHRVHALIDELGLSTYPTYHQGRHIFELGRKRWEYTGLVPRMNPILLADLSQVQWRLDRLARRVAAAPDPWSAAGATDLDSQTFATWLDRITWTRACRDYYQLLTEAVFAARPEDFSALWAAFYIGGAGGVDSVISVEGGAQQDRVVGGSQQIPLALAAELGDRVALGEVVSSIDWDATGVRVESTGRTVRARLAVVALPPPLSGRIRFSPALPTDRDQLSQRTAGGRVIKVNVVYDRPFWREAGLSGQAFGNKQSLGVVFDNSPADGTAGVLVGFFDAGHADVCSRMEPAERRALALDGLVGYFGPEAGNPVAYLERDWTAEEFSGGCYHSFPTPGALTRFGPALRDVVGPLHWAGAETATSWAGFMDGAVESGSRAAAEVIAAISAPAKV